MLMMWRGANIALGLANVALFIFWLSLSRIDVIDGSDGTLKYNFEYITFLITVLGTIVAFVGIGLGVLSIFGFQLIVERAENRADRAAREVATTLIASMIRQTNNAATVAPGAQPPPPPPPVAGAEQPETV